MDRCRQLHGLGFAWMVQGLKVRFSGLKAPAAATAAPEPRPELSKEEEKKRAKLRKAQKALGI